MIKVIFAPGMGGSIKDNWFPYAKTHLEKIGLTVIAKEFPDNIKAREKYWLPFIINELKADENTIIIGHSTGANAALRVAEKIKLLGTALVPGHYTDLGLAEEKESGYFNKPWDWNLIKKNQKFIIQFASTNDPWIPIEVSRFMHEKLNSEYYENDSMGHFGGDYNKPEFPELVAAIKKKLEIK